MNVSIAIAAAVLFALIGLPTASAYASGSQKDSSPAPPSSTEIKQAQEMMAFKSKPVIHDAKGNAITWKAFHAAVERGRHFTFKPDLQTKTVVLALLPPGVTTPGSLSAANLTGDGFSLPMTSSGLSTSEQTVTAGKSHAPHALLLIHGVHYKLVFHNEQGKTINLQTFISGASKHQRYARKLDKKTDTAILTLLPIGENAPGSKPTASLAKVSALTSAPTHGLAVTPKPGTEFARFDLPKVGGGHIDTANFKGEPYVVDFFFANCVGCIAELPILNAYHRQYPRQHLVAITFDNAKIATGFVKQRHFDWPIAYNGMAVDRKLGIKVYPTMVVVGADGKVLATRVGADTGATPVKLERWVTKSIHSAPEHATRP